MKTISEIVAFIVPRAMELNHAHIKEEVGPINYSAIFCRDDHEYEKLLSEAQVLGIIADNTPTGPLFRLNAPIQTIAGPLHLVKIRKADPTRLERGDADFTMKNYDDFKERYLNDVHFKCIDKGHFEMMELRDPKFSVLSYFSNIPLTIQLGIEK